MGEQTYLGLGYLGAGLGAGMVVIGSTLAIAKAVAAAASKPPVASSTIRLGLSLSSRSTKLLHPAGSFLTCHRSPLGRLAMSNWAFDTSMPTKLSCSLMTSPLLGGPTLQDAGSGGPGNCSGSLRTRRDDPSSPTASRDPGCNDLSRPGSQTTLS